MKKIKMLAIGNEEKFNFNYYVFEKKQKVFEELSKLFYQVLGHSWELEYDYFKRGKRTIKSWKVKKFKDEHAAPISIAHKNVRLDVFYGDKKIFITIICPEKIRKEINKELEKISEIQQKKK